MNEYLKYAAYCREQKYLAEICGEYDLADMWDHHAAYNQKLGEQYEAIWMY